MEVELFIQQGPSTTKALPVLLAQTQKKKHIAVTIVKLKKKMHKKNSMEIKKTDTGPVENSICVQTRGFQPVGSVFKICCFIGFPKQ